MYKGQVVEVKEVDIEGKVSKYAGSRGCLFLKLTILGCKGWPDRMFLYRAKTLFIEFKKPGERPEPIQLWTHDLLRRHGFQVEVVDNVEQGKVYIDEFIKRNDPMDGDGGQRDFPEYVAAASDPQL